MPGTTLRTPNNPSCSSAPDSERALGSAARDRVIEYLAELWKEEQLANALSKKGFRPSAGLIATEIHLRLKDTNFELVDNFKSRFTNTHFFKYRQTYKGIPLYGSSIIVELDEESEDKDIDPSRVDRVGNINVKPSLEELNQIKGTQTQLKSWIEKSENNSLNGLDLNPTLYYYYDDEKQSWRIVYITDIRLTESQDISKIQPLSDLLIT